MLQLALFSSNEKDKNINPLTAHAGNADKVVTDKVVPDKVVPDKVAAENKAVADASKLDGKNSDKDGSTINLTKAEINVSLDKPTSKVAFNNALINTANNSSNAGISTDLSQESEAIDIKSLQNQSSYTPQHKSDVPQFQLSLRQGAESVVQMQDMIQ